MTPQDSRPLWAVLAESDRQGASKGRVLVVDDEEDIAAILSRALAYAGYVVTIATNGQEALRRLAEHPFDLLISDIYMPVLRGDELLRQALERDPTLAALMITAIDDTACAVECLKAGAFDFLAKPFDIADVLVRVEKAMERRRLEQENRAYRDYLEQRVAETTEQLRRTVQHSMEALIHTLEAKDPYTRNHSMRVAEIATCLVTDLWPADSRLAARVRVAAIFHDIGKIGIPEQVLNKPGALTAEEFDLVRRHPVIGEAILAPMLDNEIVAIVRHHHEHWDGSGYPDALAGEAIPLGARVVAVADSFDAMVSARAHRPPRSLEDAVEILQAGSEAQWDAQIVRSLVRSLATGRIAPPFGTGTVDTAAALSDSILAPITPIPPAPPDPRVARRAKKTAHPVLQTGSRLDVNRALALRQELETLIEQRHGHEVILDLSHCRVFDDQSLQAVYALDLHARRLGGILVLRGPSAEAVQRLREAGLWESLRVEQKSQAA